MSDTIIQELCWLVLSLVYMLPIRVALVLLTRVGLSIVGSSPDAIISLSKSEVFECVLTFRRSTFLSVPNITLAWVELTLFKTAL